VDNAGFDNHAFVDKSPSRNISNKDDVFRKTDDIEQQLRRESDIGTDVDNTIAETNNDEKAKTTSKSRFRTHLKPSSMSSLRDHNKAKHVDSDVFTIIFVLKK